MAKVTPVPVAAVNGTTIPEGAKKKPVMAPPAPPRESSDLYLPTVELKGHVGIDTLPEQYVQKARKNGFSFNILCVGETAIGKTTLMESLFNMKVDLEPCPDELLEAELKSCTYDIVEGNVRIKLSIVETAGFGDQMEKDKSIKTLIKYVDKQYEAYLVEEMKVKRALQFYMDTRIHACLYLISPTGHGLRALDVAALRELAVKTNVIPVIAKADTISKEELSRFKQKIMRDLKAHSIDIYHFPTDDATTQAINESLNSYVPFAVIGSTDVIQKGNKKVRARIYPWGVVEVENVEHCDFVKLREALLRTNVEDLRDRTHSVLYEHYRKNRLSEMGLKEGDLGPGMQKKFREKREECNRTMDRKEKDLKGKYLAKASQIEDELKAKEKILEEKLDAHKRKMAEMRKKLEEEQRKLESDKAQFEQQKQAFESKSTLNRRKKK